MGNWLTGGIRDGNWGWDMCWLMGRRMIADVTTSVVDSKMWPSTAASPSSKSLAGRTVDVKSIHVENFLMSSVNVMSMVSAATAIWNIVFGTFIFEVWIPVIIMAMPSCHKLTVTTIHGESIQINKTITMIATGKCTSLGSWGHIH